MRGKHVLTCYYGNTLTIETLLLWQQRHINLGLSTLVVTEAISIGDGGCEDPKAGQHVEYKVVGVFFQHLHVRSKTFEPICQKLVFFFNDLVKLF